MSSAIRDFPDNMKRHRPFVYRRVNLHIINDSEHAGDSSAALDAQPFRVASLNPSTYGNHASMNIQLNALSSWDTTMIEEVCDPPLQFSILASHGYGSHGGLLS
jgi:hypothetical protein